MHGRLCLVTRTHLANRRLKHSARQIVSVLVFPLKLFCRDRNHGEDYKLNIASQTLYYHKTADSVFFFLLEMSLSLKLRFKLSRLPLTPM